MENDYVNSIRINGTNTQIQDYGRDQPNGVPVLDTQGKLPTKYIPNNVLGVSAPVGTLITQYKKVPMSGYLYCDGSTFDENNYPALYMYLGTNVLPDYRECVMVGAEQNTTDTITTHDVYGEGEFKDDQIQEHKHYSKMFSVTQGQNTGANIADYTTDINDNSSNSRYTLNVANARTGETTHGKQKAVYVYIKATSGLAENQQENVLNDVKGYVDNSNSYSTEEVKTGGKWIDGKPIYRKTLVFTNITLTSTPTQIGTTDIPITNITKTEELVLKNDLALTGSSHKAVYIESNGKIFASQNLSSITTGWNIYFTIEYTKTTD